MPLLSLFLPLESIALQNPTWMPGQSMNSPSSVQSLISSPLHPLSYSSLLADPPFWVHHFLP